MVRRPTPADLMAAGSFSEQVIQGMVNFKI